ncbi:RadC family protein [Adonisia turfae]|uniref:JAB domain-containing protein n=1 Tax=Adonisia turfae CCMR0081 TaxID=2292702 RepID=A0A6M0RWM6_9CYAN|nr:DNA repair protein RadC [Adonisia turfae]NEZ60634.1 JAB domain-containing protein [Adonisia turfae CCMR0081]
MTLTCDRSQEQIHKRYNLRVKDMPTEQRPRERLMAYGAKNLTLAELLAILLGTGVSRGHKLSAVNLGQCILNELAQDSATALDALRTVTPQELMTISGVGEAKAAAILAALELGKRVLQNRPADRTIVDDPAVAAAALSQDLMWQSQERFAIALLDVKHRLLGTKIISLGTATETLAHPREIFREVIKQGATRVIVAHNHPSGILEPSDADLALTRQLLEGANILGIPLLDHLILGNGDFVSLRQTTELWNTQAE